VYHSYNGPNGLLTEFQRLAAEFPEIVQLTSVGQTHQGRDVWAIKISDNVTVEEDEPEVLFDGHFHGEEWIGMEVATYIAYQLVNNYGIDADVTRLVNERQIWVIPMVNPDGRVIDSYGDGNDPSLTRGWRKNARDNNSSGGWDSCDGVDLNRNFDLGYGVGASTNPCSLEYMGPATFSEPEAQAFRTFAQNHDFRVYVSYHSYGERIFFPWGYRYDATLDDARFREVAQELKTYLPSYRSSQASLVDAAGGCSDDWMYSNFHALVYTIEVAYADHGDPAQVLSTVTPHFGAALHLINLADNPWQEAPNPPAAAFTANPITGTVPLQVQFTDQSTGTITSWSWNFGDGATSTGQNPAHTYTQAGNYAVSLTVSGPDGSDTETKTSFIIVQPAPLVPDAAFTASPTTGTAPLQVQFTDQSTGTINSWSWTFGDGSASTDRNPAHSFTQAGNYTVSLTVTGPGGSDTETKNSLIVVQPGPSPPEAAFTATPTSGPAPLQVQFTDQSTGSITAWAWNFGDDSTSTEANPVHIYAQAGTYTVSLTITGPGGNDTESKSNYISISPAVQPQRLVVRIDTTGADALVYGAYFYSNTRISYVGYYSNTQSDSTFWFGNVTIPRGADIVHAEVRLQAAKEVSWACAASIVGFAQDYPAPVTSVTDWKSRPRTNASVQWNMDPWVKGSWYSSPEIAPIVQEIIDRPGWVPGRALTFSIGPAVIGTSYRAFYERDQGYGYGAELIIDFLP
jgi:PKD repeat protein